MDEYETMAAAIESGKLQRPTRRRASIPLLLEQAQIIGATAAVLLLLSSGVSGKTISVVSITFVMTVISRIS